MSAIPFSKILVQSGRVERGKTEARIFGYPTANIAFDDHEISGAYAGQVEIDAVPYEAAIYADQKRKVLEAHIFEFSGDIYGKDVTMTLLEKISDSKVFTDMNALQAKITSDIEKVRKYFGK